MGSEQLPPAILQSFAAATPSRRQAALPSPHFDKHPPSPAHAGQPSYFASPSPTHPGSILLNKAHPSKFDDATAVPHAAQSSNGNGPAPNALGILSVPAAASSVPGGLARVGSPDGSASEASATASDGWSAAGSTSTAPSSAVGSPESKPSAVRAPSPTSSLATLTLHGAASAEAGDERTTPPSSTVRASRSPSPHCHFAPLPKVEQQERPATRRNSFAQGASAARHKLAFNEMPDEPFALELDDRLQSSIDKGIRLLPSRRSSGSASGRSRSPSPYRRPPSAQSSSRSHSPPPPLYHAKDSSDALSLHYIQGSRPRTASASRERSHEREAIKDWRDEHAVSSGRASPFDAAFAGASTSSSAVVDGAAAPAASASTTTTTTTTRRTVFAEPAIPERGIVGRCRPLVKSRARVDGGVEDVVEIEPSGSEVDDEELDQVEEEDENESDEDEDDDEGSGSDEVGDDEDAEESNGEGAREDGDAEDEEEEREAKQSKTALGAGVEVVHWHKEEPAESEAAPAVAPTA